MLQSAFKLPELTETIASRNVHRPSLAVVLSAVEVTVNVAPLAGDASMDPIASAMAESLKPLVIVSTPWSGTSGIYYLQSFRRATVMNSMESKT